jgi:hypothetical protein
MQRVTQRMAQHGRQHDTHSTSTSTSTSTSSMPHQDSMTPPVQSPGQVHSRICTSDTSGFKGWVTCDTNMPCEAPPPAGVGRYKYENKRTHVYDGRKKIL